MCPDKQGAGGWEPEPPVCTAPSILRGHARPCPRGGDLGSPDPSQVTRRLCMGRSPGRSPDMEVTPSTPCWEGPSQTRRVQPHRGPWETRQSPPQPLPTTTLPTPPPSGMRSRLTKSTHCQWALARLTAQPSCPLSRASPQGTTAEPVPGPVLHREAAAWRSLHRQQGDEEEPSVAAIRQSPSKQ